MSENKNGNSKLKITGEVLVFVAAFAVLIVLWGLWVNWLWSLLWFGVGLLLGLLEAVSVLRDGKTLSEKFGEAFRLKPTRGYILLFLLGGMFLALLYHLYAMK